MSERTLTVAEASEQTGLTEKALRRRIERGVLPSVLGPDRRRRIPAIALGLDGAAGAASRATPPTGAPAVSQKYPAGADVLERLERLARENGGLRQIEAVAGQDRQALIEARARILELEAQLNSKPARRRWWQR